MISFFPNIVFHFFGVTFGWCICKRNSRAKHCKHCQPERSMRAHGQILFPTAKLDDISEHPSPKVTSSLQGFSATTFLQA